MTDINCGKRVIRLHEDGYQEDITPVCIHRSLGVYESCHKCLVRPEVVHCSGKAVGCNLYNAGAVQLSLF